MKLQRFWIDGKITADHSFGGLFEVADLALLHQLKNVFRFKIGYEIVVFDGDGQDHECLIREFLKDKIILELKKSYASRFMPAREIWLCASIVKKDNFEWIVEKATELGVSHIVPILSDRSEKKSLNMERLEKIIIEASEQSGRGNIPRIHPIMKLEECVEYVKKIPNSKSFVIPASRSEVEAQAGILLNNKNLESSVTQDPRFRGDDNKRVSSKSQAIDIEMLAFHTEGESVQGSTLYKDKPVALFIGPEGGWSEKEVDLFHHSNIPLKCLGRQILRAETAAVAILAQIVF
jgi:16S rRNA (uracil1498-N3)-methyltransferase